MTPRLTRWFPVAISPAREGMYRVQDNTLRCDCCWIDAHWDGQDWHSDLFTRGHCRTLMLGAKRWRGLKSPALHPDGRKPPMSTFLTEKDMVELTGIRQGKDGRTREQRQVDTLRKMKIPHYVNAVGRPIVARAVIEGLAPPPMPAATWEPRLAHG